MEPFLIVNVASWVKKRYSKAKEELNSFELSRISHYCQVKLYEPLIHVNAEFWFPPRHVFCFKNVEFCPHHGRVWTLEIMRLRNFGHVLLSLSMPKSLTMNNTSIHLLRYCSLLRFYDELLRLMEDGLRSSKIPRILHLIEFFKSKLSYKIKG